MALAGLSVNEKSDLAVSLSALLIADAGGELSEDNLNAVLAASGNNAAPHWAHAFASTLKKSGGVERFLKGPGEGQYICNTGLSLITRSIIECLL